MENKAATILPQCVNIVRGSISLPFCESYFAYNAFSAVCCTGNNIYGEGIRSTLQGVKEQRSQFILMDLIRPPVVQNYIVRAENDEPELENVISELGIFGVVIR